MSYFDGRYNRLKIPNHPHANPQGYVYEHRIVVEKALGRYLETSEHVHHLNGDPLDNRLENLEVHSNSEHVKQHWKEGHYPKNCLKNPQIIICKLCGEEHEHCAKGLCTRCYARERYRNQQKEKGRKIVHRDGRMNQGDPVCSECGRHIQLQAKGLCGRCYKRIQYQKMKLKDQD